jgi:ribbon-helix-helix CopG family protein
MVEFSGHLDSRLKMCMLLRMRTTVTLDSDVAEGVKALARKRGISFKAALNHAVRTGLASGRGERREYKMPTKPMHLRPGIDLTHALRLAGELEDEEIIRKLELRK